MALTLTFTDKLNQRHSQIIGLLGYLANNAIDQITSLANLINEEPSPIRENDLNKLNTIFHDIREFIYLIKDHPTEIGYAAKLLAAVQMCENNLRDKGIEIAI